MKVKGEWKPLTMPETAKTMATEWAVQKSKETGKLVVTDEKLYELLKRRTEENKLLIEEIKQLKAQVELQRGLLKKLLTQKEDKSGVPALPAPIKEPDKPIKEHHMMKDIMNDIHQMKVRMARPKQVWRLVDETPS